MDLLGDKPKFRVNDDRWRIFSRHYAEAPQFVGAGAVVENAIVTEGSEIYGTVRNSVIGSGVVVEKGAVVEDAVIMDNTVIRSGAAVRYSIVDSDCEICKGASVGVARGEGDITVLGRGVSVAENTSIGGGQMISVD